jgi:hypothetical protein
MLISSECAEKQVMFSLENLVAWSEKQPADKEYDFWCDQCFLGQYFEDHGFRIRMIGVGTVTFKGHETRQLPPGFNEIAQQTPHTFGAALGRARRMLAARRALNPGTAVTSPVREST